MTASEGRREGCGVFLAFIHQWDHSVICEERRADETNCEMNALTSPALCRCEGVSVWIHLHATASTGHILNMCCIIKPQSEERTKSQVIIHCKSAAALKSQSGLCTTCRLHNSNFILHPCQFHVDVITIKADSWGCTVIFNHYRLLYMLNRSEYREAIFLFIKKHV